MTEYYGFCVFPQGRLVTLSLIFVSLGAVITTVFSVASCRFVRVSFVSNMGGFDQLWVRGGAVSKEDYAYQFGAGLFSWLQPTSEEASWSDGSCVGYKQRELNIVSDATFEAVRAMGVFATLIGIILTVWVSSMSCVSIGSRQIWLLGGFQLIVSALVFLLFLVLQSGICRNVGQTTKCALDEGALLAIAGGVLWFVSFLLTVRYVRSPEVLDGIDEKYASEEDEKEEESWSYPWRYPQRILNTPDKHVSSTTRREQETPETEVQDEFPISEDSISIASSGDNGELEVSLND